MVELAGVHGRRSYWQSPEWWCSIRTVRAMEERGWLRSGRRRPDDQQPRLLTAAGAERAQPKAGLWCLHCGSTDLSFSEDLAACVSCGEAWEHSWNS